MKHSITFLAAAMILASAGMSEAQTSSSTSVNEAATISQPIRLYKNTDLNFGGIVAGLVGGNVHVTGTITTVTLSGTPSALTTTTETFPGGTGPAKYTGSGTSGAGFTANVAAQVASLIVTGEPCLTYAISVTGGTLVTDGTFPGHTMVVALDPPSGGNVNVGGTAGQIANTGDPGIDKFVIGGVLTVGALQTSGLYTGTFNVSVNYN